MQIKQKLLALGRCGHEGKAKETAQGNGCKEKTSGCSCRPQEQVSLGCGGCQPSRGSLRRTLSRLTRGLGKNLDRWAGSRDDISEAAIDGGMVGAVTGFVSFAGTGLVVGIGVAAGVAFVAPIAAGIAGAVLVKGYYDGKREEAADHHHCPEAGKPKPDCPKETKPQPDGQKDAKTQRKYLNAKNLYHLAGVAMVTGGAVGGILVGLAFLGAAAPVAAAVGSLAGVYTGFKTYYKGSAKG